MWRDDTEARQGLAGEAALRQGAGGGAADTEVGGELIYLYIY